MSFLTLDGTIVIQLVNFVIFFAILNVVFLRPVAAAIRRRREHINGVLADYERYQAEAKALRDQAERVRAAARRDAEQRLAVARAKTSNEAAERAAHYAREAQAIVEEADRKVAAELEAARAGGEPIVRSLAELMVERTTAEARS